MCSKKKLKVKIRFVSFFPPVRWCLSLPNDSNLPTEIYFESLYVSTATYMNFLCASFHNVFSNVYCKVKRLRCKWSNCCSALPNSHFFEWQKWCIVSSIPYNTFIDTQKLQQNTKQSEFISFFFLSPDFKWFVLFWFIIK